MIFACGRYEGIDARVGEYYGAKKNFTLHEVSIGDYVLGGGEVAAMVIIEATAGEDAVPVTKNRVCMFG